MNFTPKHNVRPAIRGLLTIAVVGLIGWVSHDARTPAPIVATEHTYTVQQPFQTDITVPVVPAVLTASDLQTAARSEYYQPVSKHWWKRNAPIVGGAAGGALVGGLIGGGPGALIGGAAGGTGGYLYKRSRHHHHYH
jgi:hypothetical protein